MGIGNPMYFNKRAFLHINIYVLIVNESKYTEITSWLQFTCMHARAHTHSLSQLHLCSALTHTHTHTHACMRMHVRAHTQSKLLTKVA